MRAQIAAAIVFTAASSASYVCAADVSPDSPTDEHSAEAASQGSIAEAAGRGAFLAGSQAASLEGSAMVAGFGGYDGARRTATFESRAELRVWGPVVVSGGALYSDSAGRVRPSVGVRIEALRERRHGVDGSIGLFYRPEGLTEPEGEIEMLAAFGAHLGRTYFLGNLVYGQDADGHERDGELRASAIRPLGTRFLVGLDGRLRGNLGAPPPIWGRVEPTFDAFAGPAASVGLGPVALAAEIGGAAVQLPRAGTAYGALVVLGAGTVF